MYLIWVWLHIVGAFAFFAAHGVAVAIAVRLRTERRPEQIATLLELSAMMRPTQYVSLSVLLVAGAMAGFVGGWWAHGWIWASLFLLVLMLVMALPLVPYFRRVRMLVQDPSESDRESLDRLLRSPRPLVIAAGETVGTLCITLLMVFKPF